MRMCYINQRFTLLYLLAYCTAVRLIHRRQCLQSVSTLGTQCNLHHHVNSTLRCKRQSEASWCVLDAFSSTKLRLVTGSRNTADFCALTKSTCRVGNWQIIQTIIVLVSQEIIRFLSQQLCLHSYTSASDTHTCDRQTDGRDCLTD